MGLKVCFVNHIEAVPAAELIPAGRTAAAADSSCRCRQQEIACVWYGNVWLSAVGVWCAAVPAILFTDTPSPSLPSKTNKSKSQLSLELQSTRQSQKIPRTLHLSNPPAIYVGVVARPHSVLKSPPPPLKSQNKN
jgi:hypothetical protein